jgi:hypothetical protein
MQTARWWATALGSNATFRQVPSKSLDLPAHQRAVGREIRQFLQRL